MSHRPRSDENIQLVDNLDLLAENNVTDDPTEDLRRLENITIRDSAERLKEELGIDETQYSQEQLKALRSLIHHGGELKSDTDSEDSYNSELERVK